MKKWICVALIVALMPIVGHASPELDPFHCLLAPELKLTGTLEEPFDRWARELVALIQPEVHYAAWPEGQSLLIDVWIGNLFGFSIELLNEGNAVAMQTSLVDGDWAILPPDAASGALALMAGVQGALAPDLEWPQADCTLNLNVGRGIEQLRMCAAAARGWADVASEPNREYTQAIAIALDGCADILGGEPPGAPLLSVFVDYQAPNLVPGTVERDWPDAPPSMAADMVSLIPGEVLRTIAGLEP